MKPNNSDLLWEHHHAQWRNPKQVISLWEEATREDTKSFSFRTVGDWWAILEQVQVTLIVTREYEHLALALSVEAGQPVISYLKLPHPSGIAFDAERGVVHIACTRNPNQVLELKPIIGTMPRLDVAPTVIQNKPIVPVRSYFYPGSLYLHDLAVIHGELYGNSVGQNAVVRLREDGTHECVWWPLCIEREGVPIFARNHIQLNSIAAGDSLNHSFFTASTGKISARRPGHRNFPVDRVGVVFSGETREPMARGLTRPHSARLHGGRVWVANSGYGEIGYAESGKFTVVSHLPGWTRGLVFLNEIAIVGTSRVIPRFRQYAPGLDVDNSQCGIHAVDTQSGRILGSLLWTHGNQIFAIEALPRTFTGGFPFRYNSRGSQVREKNLFYAFRI